MTRIRSDSSYNELGNVKDIGNKILLFYLLFYVKEHEKVS